MPEFHQGDAFGHVARLVGVGCQGMSRFRCTEAAAPCAYLTQDHEGCGPAAPAFGLIGAVSAGADGVQSMFLDDLTHLGIFGRAVQPDLEPSGFFQEIYLVIKLRHLSSLFSN